jgi:preprotein translocase subunit SecE
VARDRQRAKQRQAERRARRQQQRATGQAPVEEASAANAEAPPAVPGIDDPRAANPAPGIFPDVAVGAPPEQEGRSDFVGRDEPELELEGDDPELEAEALEVVDEHELDGAEPADEYAPRGRLGDSAEAARVKERPRVVQFLIASWAELQRVQWPDRQTLTTLTGVVLGFVLIMGGYLGLLDAIFSRVIQAIL